MVVAEDGGGNASDETKVVGSMESDAYGWVFFFRNDEAMMVYGGLYHGSPGFMAAYEETSVLPATKLPCSKIQKLVSQFKSSYLQYSIPVVATATSSNPCS
jgi:hypothetical protein